MGCGKTTLGIKLSKKLNYKFLDTDSVIEREEGMTVSEIFDQKGERYFRECEQKLIKELANSNKCVISTGGGFPCFNNNMLRLNEIGQTLYLKLSPNELVRRIQESKTDRPLIKVKSSEELVTFIENLLEERNPYYEMANETLIGRQQRLNSVLELLSESL